MRKAGAAANRCRLYSSSRHRYFWMPKFKVPLHQTSTNVDGIDADWATSGWHCGVGFIIANNKESPTRCRTCIHTRALRTRVRVRCYGLPVCVRRHRRLGQVSDKARSHQVLRGLSVCASSSIFSSRVVYRNGEGFVVSKCSYFWFFFFVIHLFDHATRIFITNS